MNRYFIVNSSDINKNTILGYCVSNGSTTRYSLDGSKFIAKLPINDTNDYEELSEYTEYTHSEILNQINTSEWVEE